MIRFTDKAEKAPVATSNVRTHKFAVGANVLYLAAGAEEPGSFRVTKCLPEKAGAFQYRIKGEKGREQVADEASLTVDAAAESSGRLAL